jgi:hypothetical protein
MGTRIAGVAGVGGRVSALDGSGTRKDERQYDGNSRCQACIMGAKAGATEAGGSANRCPGGRALAKLAAAVRKSPAAAAASARLRCTTSRCAGPEQQRSAAS